MPQFDRTGPAGAGPRTGRGRGQCGGGMTYGRCRGGFGFGRFGRWYPSQPELTKEKETEMLNEEAGMLQKDIEEIKERLDELKK